jgi:uncharacterized protein YxjI
MISQSIHNDLPNDFKLESKILTFGTDMYITNDSKENFGKIEERVLSFGKKFEYKDNTNKIIATAKEEVLTWATKIDINDSTGRFIGSVNEEIIESLLSWYSIYTIKDENGKVMAKSKKLELMSANVDIFDNSGDIVANFSQEAFTFGDNWDIHINSGCKVDKRLIIFIPSFISSSQSERSESDNNNKK